jgi:hypothetical protein
LATPLFSGLAAIAGVLLVAVVPNVADIDVSSVTEDPDQQETTAVSLEGSGQATFVRTTDPRRGLDPVAAVQAEEPDEGANEDPPPLGAIFDFNAINFVIAAIFGLSPVYLFQRLGQSNQLLANLNSTKPTSRTGA